MQGGEQIPLASHLLPNTCMNRAHDFADYFINISSDGSFWSLYHIDQSISDSPGFIASLATSLAHLYQYVRHIFAWDHDWALNGQRSWCRCIKEILHKCGMVDWFEQQHWHQDSVSETYRSVVICLDRLEQQQQSRDGQTVSDFVFTMHSQCHREKWTLW